MSENRNRIEKFYYLFSMEKFAKVFKNVVLLLNKGSVVQANRWSCSLRVLKEEKLIEVYYEKGQVDLKGSYSKGKLKRFRYKGTPTLDKLGSALLLPFHKNRIVFMKRTLLHLGGNELCPQTEGVSLYEYIYDPLGGDIREKNVSIGEEKEIKTIGTSSTLEDFLERSFLLWKSVDEL